MTQSLIGTALIGIVVSAFSITMGSFQQSSRALAQKMEITQLQTNIKGRLAAANLCSCNLQAATGTIGGTRQGMMGTGSFTLTLNTLYGRCNGTQTSSPILEADRPVPDSLTNLSVENIQVEEFTNLNAGLYTANLVVRFKAEGLVVGRKPLTIPLTVQTQGGSGGTVQITSCSTAEELSPGDLHGGIPGTLAGDPGSQCTYGGTKGPQGITMYTAPDPNSLRGGAAGYPTSKRMCCITAAAAAAPDPAAADQQGTYATGGSVLKCL